MPNLRLRKVIFEGLFLPVPSMPSSHPRTRRSPSPRLSQGPEAAPLTAFLRAPQRRTPPPSPIIATDHQPTAR